MALIPEGFCCCGLALDSGVLWRPYTYADPVMLRLTSEIESSIGGGTWLPGNQKTLGFRTSSPGQPPVIDHQYKATVALRSQDKSQTSRINDFPAWRYSGLMRLFVQAIAGADRLGYFFDGTGRLGQTTRVGLLLSDDLRAYLVCLPAIASTTSETVTVFPLQPAVPLDPMRDYLAAALSAEGGQMSQDTSAALAHYLSAQRLILVNESVYSYGVTVSGLASIQTDRGTPVWGHWHWPYDPAQHECSAIFRRLVGTGTYRTARVSIQFNIPSAQAEDGGARMTATLDTGEQSAAFTLLSKDRIYDYTATASFVPTDARSRPIYGFYRRKGWTTVEYASEPRMLRDIGQWQGGSTNGWPSGYCSADADVTYPPSELQTSYRVGTLIPGEASLSGERHDYQAHTLIRFPEEDPEDGLDLNVSQQIIYAFTGHLTYPEPTQFTNAVVDFWNPTTPTSGCNCLGEWSYNGATGTKRWTGQRYAWDIHWTYTLVTHTVPAAALHLSPGRNRTNSGGYAENPDGVLFWLTRGETSVTSEVVPMYTSDSLRIGTFTPGFTGTIVLPNNSPNCV